MSAHESTREFLQTVVFDTVCVLFMCPHKLNLIVYVLCVCRKGRGCRTGESDGRSTGSKAHEGKLQTTREVD